jgi:hypothetical protein
MYLFTSYALMKLLKEKITLCSLFKTSELVQN